MPFGVIFVFYLLGEKMVASVSSPVIFGAASGVDALPAQLLNKAKPLFEAIQEGNLDKVNLSDAREVYKPLLKLINEKLTGNFGKSEFSQSIDSFLEEHPPQQLGEFIKESIFFLESVPLSVLVPGTEGKTQAVFLKRLDSGLFALDEDALKGSSAHMQDRPVVIGRFDVKNENNIPSVSFVDKKGGFIARGKLCNAVAAAIFIPKIKTQEEEESVVLLELPPDDTVEKYMAPGGAVDIKDYENAKDKDGKINYLNMFALAALRELLEEAFGFKEEEHFTKQFYKNLKENNSIELEKKTGDVIEKVSYTIEAHVLLQPIEVQPNKQVNLNRYFDGVTLHPESNGFCCSPTVVIKLSSKLGLPTLVPELDCEPPVFGNLSDILGSRDPRQYRGLTATLNAFQNMPPQTRESSRISW